MTIRNLVTGKRLQNRIAESRIALPVVAIYALLVCVACGLNDGNYWQQCGLFLVSAYFMMVLNNVQALIRIYSRMVSCSYILLSIMTGNMLLPISSVAVQLCAIVSFLFLFRAYQDKESTGLVFYAFLLLGIASTVFIQVLFYVPVIWVLLYTHVLAGNVRTFSASILGLLIPYWFVGGYYLFIGDIGNFDNHFNQFFQFSDISDFSLLSSAQSVTFLFLIMLSIVGIIHFYRNSYKDKIKTRMQYEVFIILDVSTVVFIVLQPQHYESLVGLLVVHVSPLIAHFISLTKTKITNIAFFVLVAVVMLITVYNLWMPLLSF